MPVIVNALACHVIYNDSVEEQRKPINGNEYGNHLGSKIGGDSVVTTGTFVAKTRHTTPKHPVLYYTTAFAISTLR